MKGSAVLYVGVFSGLAFFFGWAMHPAFSATMAITFICGLSAVFAQLSSRDLLARIYGLMERGADEISSDGGELLDDSSAMRDRISAFTIQTMLAGVLAPALATMNTMFPSPWWSAVAMAAAAYALGLSVFLYFANKQLGALLIAERTRRALAKRQREAIAGRKDLDREALAKDPNMDGYTVTQPARFTENL